MKGSHNSTLGQYAGASPSPPVQFVSNFQLKYLAQCWPAQSKTSWRVNPQTWDHLLCHLCRYICVPYWWAQSCATSGWKSLHPGALLCHPKPAVMKEHIWVHIRASQEIFPCFLSWAGPAWLLQCYQGAFMRFTPCNGKVFIRNTPSSLSFMINNVYWCSLPSVK